MESVKTRLRSRGQLDGCQGRVGRWKRWVKGVKRYSLPVIRQISAGDVMYGMMTIVNNIVFDI